MKTVIIWDSVGEAPILFATMVGDYSPLHEKYINSDEDDAVLDALDELQNSEEFKNNLSADFPYDAVKEGAKVIVCGFLP